jgi:hypothetical protein
MIGQGYQLWYDCTVSPTLTCLYIIINTDTLAQDINYKEKKKNYFLLMSMLAVIMTRSLDQ